MLEVCVRASTPACVWKEQSRAAQVLEGFPPPGWARHNGGAADTRRGDLAVTPGHCSAGQGQLCRQEHFPSCLLLDQDSAFEGNCGIAPSCLSQGCTPQVPFWGS